MKIAIYHAYKPPRREFGGDLGTMYIANKAREQGHDVIWVENISQNLYPRADVYFCSDFSGMPATVFDFLKHKPRVFICHQTYAYKQDLPIFHGNNVVVWLAPNHREHNNQIQGKHHIVKPVYIDHTKFFDLGYTRKKANLYVGEIARHKIMPAMVQDMEKSKDEFYLYGKTTDEFLHQQLKQLPNVFLMGQVNQEAMNTIYNGFETFYWRLDRYGNFGRTNVEAMLAGCRLDVNKENFGLFKFDVDFNDRSAIVDWLDEGLETFWPDVLDKF